MGYTWTRRNLGVLKKFPKRVTVDEQVGKNTHLEVLVRNETKGPQGDPRSRVTGSLRGGGDDCGPSGTGHDRGTGDGTEDLAQRSESWTQDRVLSKKF